MLSLLTGSVGKFAMYAALVAGLGGGALYVVHLYNANVRNSVVMAEQNARMATMTADHNNAVAALEQRAKAAEAQAEKLSHIREAIAHAAPSSSCIRSAPLRAALGGLRNNVSH